MRDGSPETTISGSVSAISASSAVVGIVCANSSITLSQIEAR
jgi:hypothetical protein